MAFSRCRVVLHTLGPWHFPEGSPFSVKRLYVSSYSRACVQTSAVPARLRRVLVKCLFVIQGCTNGLARSQQRRDDRQRQRYVILHLPAARSALHFFTTLYPSRSPKTLFRRTHESLFRARTRGSLERSSAAPGPARGGRRQAA